MGEAKLINIPKDIRTILETFELGRPGAWKHENLLKRSLRLARYCRKIIEVRGEELGLSRDRDYKNGKRMAELEQQVIQAEQAQHDAEDQVGRLQEVASAAAWVIADHMSGSYDALVPSGDGDEYRPSTSEEHGDGICRVLALQLAKLEPEDKVGIDGFIDDDFERTYGLLQRNLPEETKR